MSRCAFNEPWVGQCEQQAIAGSLCCAKHSEEKCQVCGKQATTRCQASIGLMCGIPLCHQCGSGEMCLFHATSGPLYVIRAMLGYGPHCSVFSDRTGMAKEAELLEALKSRMELFKPPSGLSMNDFKAAMATHDETRKS
jgi:hypothetical protein